MNENKMVKIVRKGGRNAPKGRLVKDNVLAEVKEILGCASLSKEQLIENLHYIQDKLGYLPADHLHALATLMKLPMSLVYEVATFYHHFDIVKEGETPPPSITVRVCTSLSCEMFGAQNLLKSLQQHYGDQVRVLSAPCVGRCAKAPIAVVEKNPIEEATVEKISEVISNKKVEAEAPSHAQRYDDYVASGGYRIYQHCLEGRFERENVIREIESSGLRGLGGAGFLAGKKWSIVASQKSPKVVAVNIDEGEPGTFKDRYYLESNPHSFIEGALIAAWAIDAKDIYIYLRDEYSGCRLLLTEELESLLTKATFHLPHLVLRRGGGAYICGEESGMIESIEGKRGEPRLRPPYVAEVGVFGRPTLEHNMETLHWIPHILTKGGKEFNCMGRRDRHGHRSFSVSGRVCNPGVHIAPAGITISELIEEYCGGMLSGHQFYAYLPGGASGGILPASHSDIPLDFDTIQQADENCFIGSAAIIVLSDQDRARDAALNMMRFFEDESCGQCTPCRVGTSKAVMLMQEEKWNQALLEELSQAMTDASICGLGQAAPNPIRCIIRHFSHEI